MTTVLAKPTTFVCNICDTPVSTQEVGRETVNCLCGSTARWRAVIYCLSTALFGHSISLPRFPERPDLVGVGLSDWPGYAKPLAAKLSYTNTFYDDRGPFLDITDPPKEKHGTLDFLIASDVFEHVGPPVQRAFDGAFRLLKPGGAFILTTPYEKHGETVEHFPSLHDWEILEHAGHKVLVNETIDGKHEVFEYLDFHGGPAFPALENRHPS